MRTRRKFIGITVAGFLLTFVAWTGMRFGAEERLEGLRAEVTEVEIGQCDAVPADPVTGRKLVYCCLDEIYVMRQEGGIVETLGFLQKVMATADMSPQEALEFYEGAYESSVHEKYGWQTACGGMIECETCVWPDPDEFNEVMEQASSAAQTEACGDGIRQGVEQCDDGSSNSNAAPDACRPDCTLPRCGDGVIDQGETCDQGGVSSTCRANCVAVRCGDGITDANEECDDGNLADGDGCNSLCEDTVSFDVASSYECGNGIVENGEECDDGMLNSNAVPDACRTSCIRSFCSDSVRDQGEACDDGNLFSGDGCSPLCAPEISLVISEVPEMPDPVCGNAAVEEGEECDDGNDDDADGCTSLCIAAAVPRCGDGITQQGEECDSGEMNSNQMPDACRLSCALPRMGDAVVDRGEQCDDANTVDGDGCSAAGAIEFTNVPLEPLYPAALIPIYPTIQDLEPTSLNQTGPAAVAILAAGAAAGVGLMRRRSARRR